MKKRAWMAPNDRKWKGLSWGEKERIKAQGKKADEEKREKLALQRAMELDELLAEARSQFPFAQWESNFGLAVARDGSNMNLAWIPPFEGPCRSYRTLSAIEDFRERIANGMWPDFQALHLAHQKTMQEQAELESLITPTESKPKKGGRL